MKKRLRFILAGALLIGSFVLLTLFLSSPKRPGDTARAAARLERVLTRRTDALEKKAGDALYGNIQEWIDSKKFKDDETLWRYLGDDVQDWTGSLSLSGASDTLGYYRSGARWYLAKKLERDDVSVIYALTIIDPYDNGTANGTNRKLHLSPIYSVKPLSSEEGSIVKVGGSSLFKVVMESQEGTAGASSIFIWLSFCCFLIAIILLAIDNKSFRLLTALISGLIVSTVAMWLLGRTEMGNFNVFSPSIFAGGEVFYSLAAVILFNASISLFCLVLFLSRQAVFSKADTKNLSILLCATDILLFVAGLVYTHFSFKSVITNSGICLELYKIDQISIYSVIIYGSYLVMLAALPLLVVVAGKSLDQSGTNRKEMRFSLFRVLYPTATAIYLVALSSILGFKKEQSMLEIWAQRLSMDRDIAVEMSLRRAENEIVQDAIIASLSLIPDGEKSIENRLSEIYMRRLAKSYNFIVETNPEDISVIIGKEPIAEGSRFYYLGNEGAYPSYGGLFFFNIPSVGVSRILIKAEPVLGRKTKGYASLLGMAPPGRTMIPSAYSYARYQEKKLIDFRGDFPYKTTLDSELLSQIYKEKLPVIKSEGNTIFIYRISDSEVVMISRPTLSYVNYLTVTVLLAIVLFALISLYSIYKKKLTMQPKGYFKSTITWTLMTSLLITLVIISTVSVFFVYEKNESNMKLILSDKINSTQSLIESRIHGAEKTSDLMVPEMISILERVAESSDSDVSMFSPDGELLLSTSQFLFDNYALSRRIDGKAFKNIMRDDRRLYFQKEKFGNKQYYQMYAPLIGEGGHTLAIISTPYTDDSYDFEKDAIAHLTAILVVFLLLLILSRLIIQAVSDKMFGPLGEMSLKMSTGGLDSFEYINYERDDEITSIVGAYNRMVAKLSESSKELASAERNKAWNEMARQVAHEIKNPLTPMKLQIQRLIRLKSNNAPDWQDKFDEIAAVILDHIDILSDTANEFSSFAKLYSEPHTKINLGDTIQEEISMFDNYKNVSFEFLGLKDAVISGPKPQLTRVFVNLLGNAVQALEGKENGMIVVSLRNGDADGYLDIVFEDNGPGVDEDKVDKLFTPNFTTKNGGSGLGLAISRSILETCGATIAYSRSFRLGGACFTIHYPA